MTAPYIPRDGLGFVSPYRQRLAEAAQQERAHPSIYDPQHVGGLNAPTDSSLTWNPAQDKLAALQSAILGLEDHHAPNVTYPTAHRTPKPGLLESLLSAVEAPARDFANTVAPTASDAASMNQPDNPTRAALIGRFGEVPQFQSVSPTERAGSAASLAIQTLAPAAAKVGGNFLEELLNGAKGIPSDIMEGIPVDKPIARGVSASEKYQAQMQDAFDRFLDTPPKRLAAPPGLLNDLLNVHGRLQTP